MILPFTRGNVVKTLIIGLVTLVIGLYFVTDMARRTLRWQPTRFMQQQAIMPLISLTDSQAVQLDFASSLFGWVIYRGVKLSYVGMGVLAVITVAMMVINRQRIVKEEKKSKKVKK